MKTKTTRYQDTSTKMARLYNNVNSNNMRVGKGAEHLEL